MQQQRHLAIVTGASSGIGLELAILAARDGLDLVIGADTSQIFEVGERLRALGAAVEAVEADLSTVQGNDELLAAAQGRPIALLCANAGHGLGRAFIEQNFDAIRHVIDTNVTGTLYLLHRVSRAMTAQGNGRILITGSIAGFIPGTYQAVYNGTKAFIDSFAIALRAELKGSGVTVTNLLPGPTETDFFRRADLLDTKYGAGTKQPADQVARIGYEAMLRGEAQVVAGWKNKLQTVMAGFTPATLLAEQHRMQAAPGTANH
jgi:short-subunit dehydrogenase